MTEVYQQKKKPSR